MTQLEEVKRQFEEFQKKELRATTPEQKARVLALARDLPRLWNAPTTRERDKKRMLRLLIKDITVEKSTNTKHAVLHIRWQGGACEDINIDLPPNMAERLRYPEEVIERVRTMARDLYDVQIATVLNEEGRTSAQGKPFTASMIRWIRYRHKIPAPQFQHPEELTVKQVAQKFCVSPHVVYYWIERGIIKGRRVNRAAPYWITIDPQMEGELLEWVRNSSKIQEQKNKQQP